MDAPRCGICDMKFSEYCIRNTITDRGLVTLIQTSKDRGDGKWRDWQQQPSIICHRACRKGYTSSNSVVAALKRNLLDSTDEDDDDDIIEQQREQSAFDYSTSCIFCGRSCNVDNEIQKPRAKRKRIICKVEEDADLRKEIQESIMKCDEKWSRIVQKRILDVPDLTAVNAVYHSACHLKFINRKPFKPKKQPPVFEYTSGWHKLCKFIENSEKGQYTLDELRVIMECDPSDGYLKTGLAERFGDDIIFSSLSNNKTLVTLKTFRDKILYEFFKSNERSEIETTNQSNVVEKAAQIVLRDLCAMEFIDYRTNLITTESINILEDIIPESLKLFLNHVVGNQKSNPEQYKNKKISIAHAIMAAARPNAFISPLQLASSVYVHSRTKSKILVKLLSKLGFGVSYLETLRCETIEQNKSKLTNMIEAFNKFIFANLENAAINAGDNAAALYAIGSVGTIKNQKNNLVTNDENNAATMNSEESAITPDNGHATT